MELKLAQQGEVMVLEAKGTLEAGKIPVLKAGIANFVKSGKTRIILDLSGCGKAEPAVLEEVLKLVADDARVILAFVGDEAALKVAAGAHAARIFGKLDAAVAAMPPDPLTEAKAEVAKRDHKIAALEKEKAALAAELLSANGRVKNSDPEAAKKVKAELGVARESAVALEEQVRTLLKERKKAFEMEGLQTRIEQLEAALVDYAEKGKPPEAAPAAGAPAAPTAKH